MLHVWKKRQEMSAFTLIELLVVVAIIGVLAAVGVASIALFWRLVGASVIMLVFGFLGESGAIDGHTLGKRGKCSST